MNTFSIGACIKFGWETFWKRPGIFIKAAVLLFLISLVFNVVQSLLDLLLESQNSTTLIIGGIASFVVALVSIYVSIIINNMGGTVFMLKAHDSLSSVTLRDLWHPHPFWKYVFTSILATLAVLVGLVFLIVPGIIIGLAFTYALLLVLERNLGPIEAMKESARITRGNRWKLFLFGLVLIGVNLLGFLALLIGLFVSVPVSFLAALHAYRTLAQKQEPAA